MVPSITHEPGPVGSTAEMPIEGTGYGRPILFATWPPTTSGASDGPGGRGAAAGPGLFG